jgi:cytochrome oxidase Cu insertion factor (SCO1/SenC/PrrC family)
MSLSRQQYTLIGIFALFLGPVILVMLMRSSWWQYQPAGLKNHGQLVRPPVQLSLSASEAIDRRWVVLYMLEKTCDRVCIEWVTSLRQIHKAAGRNREHLSIVLLSKDLPDPAQRAALEAIYPHFIWATDQQAGAVDTLDAINNKLLADSGQANTIHTYILDPMLNVILAYNSEADPNDIHKDLKRLLKWSDQD